MIDSSAIPTPSCRRRPVSTTHMRCPPSSGNSPITSSSFPWLFAAHECVNGTPASGLGDGGGFKSRSPLAGAPSAGLEAATVTQAQSFVSFSSDRSCVQLRSARSSRSMSQPWVSCGVAPHQLISGRRSQRLHHEPPCLGQRAGQTGPFFSSACFSPSWMRALALDFGDLIRPDRPSVYLSSHGAVSLRLLGCCPAHAAYSKAPSGTRPCFT